MSYELTLNGLVISLSEFPWMLLDVQNLKLRDGIELKVKLIFGQQYGVRGPMTVTPYHHRRKFLYHVFC